MTSRVAQLLTVLVLFGAAVGALPAHARADDPARAIGGDSLLCNPTSDLDARSQQLCKLTGAPAQSHPTANYGLDTRGDSVKDVVGGALQALIGLVWSALLWGVRLVMFLLEAALSLDLVGDSLPQIGTAIATFTHELRPWVAAVLVCLGVWGMVGLYRGQASQTLGGMLTAVILIGAGLAVANAPEATVGRVSSLLNTASLSALSVVPGHSANAPMANFAGVERRFYGQLVEGPACALNLGSTKVCGQQIDPHYCPSVPRQPVAGTGLPTAPPPPPWEPGVPPASCTIQDILLETPAGSGQRAAIYKILKDGKRPEKPSVGPFNIGDWLEETADWIPGVPDADQERQRIFDDAMAAWNRLEPALKRYRAEAKSSVTIQESNVGNVVTRATALLLFAVAFICTMLLLAHFGMRILLAKMRTLVLLLMLPLLLLAPAFGEAGRSTFVQGAWTIAKSMLEVVSRVFALTAVLFVSTVLPKLGGEHAGATAMVWAAAFGGLYTFRNDLDPWRTAERRSALPGILGALGALYFGGRFAHAVGGGLARLTGLRRFKAHRLARAEAAHEFEREAREATIEAEARADVGREWEGKVDRARETAAESADVQPRLDRVRELRDDNRTAVRKHRADPRLVSRAETLGRERDQVAAKTRHIERQLRKLDNEVARDTKQRQDWADKELDAGINWDDREEQHARQRKEDYERRIEGHEQRRQALVTSREQLEGQLRKARIKADAARKVAEASARVPSDVTRRGRALERLEANLRGRMPAKEARQAAERILADHERGARVDSRAVADRANELRGTRSAKEILHEIKTRQNFARRRRRNVK